MERDETELKVFSDSSYIPPGKSHVVMLYPFWGKGPEDPMDPSSGRFDRYAEMGSHFFQMTALEEADVAVFPADWHDVLEDREAVDRAEQFVGHARQAGKPIIIFFWSDSVEDVPYCDAVVFRTSFYRSRRKPNEFAMPAWSEDFVGKYLGARLPVRPKREKPIVGFCGHATPLTVRDILRWWADLVEIRKKANVVRLTPGRVIRWTALRVLSRSPLVDTNFLVRDDFLGRAVLPDGRKDLDLLRKIRLEFVQNMVDSDYIVCARGSGNFSYRLYETLCCGRIPVFIDTDCVLPYDFVIEWKKHCVWVEESELPLIAEKVAKFHRNLSPQDFMDLQHECRRLWEQWLSPEGFFANFFLHFSEDVI